MKRLNKVLSIFLCLALLFSLSSVSYGVEIVDHSDEVKAFAVEVVSKEYPNRYVTFYEYGGRYYLDLNDIKEFTRCTLTEDEASLTLKHGIREIVIEKSTGHMVDSGLVDQGNITLLRYGGSYLCEGIPMLRYLGAACSICDGTRLEVLMPTYTLWESLMPDYLHYCFDINELYGGEKNVKISLICDTLADVFDSVSGHGLMGSFDVHMADALYEALDVDMMKYGSVQQTMAEDNRKINDFLTSDVCELLLDGGEITADAAYEALDYYAGFYLNSEIWKNSYLEKLYFDAGDLQTASALASEINKQVYEQSVLQANLTGADALLSAGMLAMDTALTSYRLMQYSDDTKNLLARTINDDMFARTGCDSVGWKNAADRISATLESTASVWGNTAAEKVTETVLEKVAEGGLTTALSAFTAEANVYTAAIRIGQDLASLINYSSNQAFSADMNAILLNMAQHDVATMASRLFVDEQESNHFENPESLECIKDMFTLYYRITIAFSENIAQSIEEFGTKSGRQWIDWFRSTEDWSVANYTADYLYRITNCVIVPIVDYAGISDHLITREWIRSNGIDMQQTLVTDALYEYLYSEEDDMSYCYHIPRFVCTGDGFEALNAEIYDDLYALLEEDVYQNLEMGTSIILTNFSYGYGAKNGYGSLILCTKIAWAGAESFEVYNVDLRDGSRISAQELLNLYGLTNDEYRQLAKTKLGEKFDSVSGNWSEESQADEDFAKLYQRQRDSTISEENIDAIIPYIDAGGDLCCAARIYSMAGAEFYWYLVNLTGTSKPTPIACNVDHAAQRAAGGDLLQYFIENCDCHYFKEEDVKDFDEEMCLYARNAVFAKSGRKFNTPELQDYFEQYAWYDPHIEPDDFTSDMFNEIQRANVDLILAREAELEDEASLNALSGEAGIYTRYLYNGGYEELLGFSVDEEALEISTCLADLDYDGTDELLLYIATGNYGVRGEEVCTFLLDIKDEHVFLAAEAYYGGGSMGGGYLEIRYDKESSTHVPVHSEYLRDGVEKGESYLEVYSVPGFSIGEKIKSTYYNLSAERFQDAIHQIQSETTLYYIDGYDFYCYQIDGQYVSKETYENAVARYEDAQEGFQLTPGTYTTPIA